MRRFYSEASIAEAIGGWQVQLDGRGVKTVGGRAQVVPTRALAEALAAEWAAQGEEIDPASFALRDMADYALDVVVPNPVETIVALAPYGETDTLCYRAEPDEPLHARQVECWEPLLSAAEARWDVNFERVPGVLHRPQPAATLSRIRTVLTALDPFALAALRNTASLAASLVIGLAALEQGADIEALWAAANLEEDWQSEQWGADHEAAALRSRKLAEFAVAVRFAELACSAR